MELGRHADAVSDLALSVDHIRDASRPAILGALCFSYHAVGYWGPNYQSARLNLKDLLLNANDEKGALIVSPFHLQPLNIPLAAEQHAARQASLKSSATALDLKIDKRLIGRGDKIRLGYLSPDFMDHSMARAIRDLIPRHDRSKFAVEGFALNRVHDRTTLDFSKTFDKFHNVSALDNVTVARFIAQRKIDILIDLAGHTRGSRLEILAHQPAPVQIHAIGYGRPICAPFLPWRLTDSLSTPADTRYLYDETLIDLPDNALPSSPPLAVDETVSRADIDLPEDAFIFANFGGAYKIDPETFDQWMEILRQIPSSLLMLLSVHDQVVENLSRAAEALGVVRERLVFAPFLKSAQHLGRYRLIDLCLDTLIHNGGVTTTDALWAGTPVLTTYRADMPDRTGASLLHAAGMPDLVATDNAEFVARAIEIATTKGEAARLRHTVLAQQITAPLFDMEKYTRSFEAALLDVWARDTHTSSMKKVERP